MKTVKIILPLIVTLIMSCTARAGFLFEDYTNYPYNNGPIEGQGPWFTTTTDPRDDIMVTNNVILLNATNYDTLEAPTNGWPIPQYYDDYTYASFRLMVTQLPSAGLYSNGTIVCEFVNTNAYDDNTNGATVCHLFLDQLGTTLPGTFRLGIGNYATEFSGAGESAPPHNYPMDLATDVWYSVVILYDNSGDNLEGASLWINPSLNDWVNWLEGNNIVSPGVATDYAYGNDGNGSPEQDNITIQEIRFIPSVYAGNFGISNVLVATDDNGNYGDGFSEVLTTNFPVIAIQPVPGTNYSGNPLTLTTLASGVDVTYQWYDNSGPLSDGQNYSGSQNNILTINSLSASDTYYCIITDAYGNTVTTSNAFEYVIITPTAPFFPTNDVPVNATNNLFAYTGFSDPALGTGPLTYQWYYAPTNVPLVFTQLVGQTSSSLSLYLADYTSEGSYYVVASNDVNSGSIAYGPTNTLTEVPPAYATMTQLHNLVFSFVNTPGNGYAADPGNAYVVSTNVAVNGYVTTRTVAPGDGLGNSYTEYFIEDTNGYGAEIYLSGVNNTNTPALGTDVTVSGELELYHNQMQLSPAGLNQIIPNASAPVATIAPVLGNSMFNTLLFDGTSSNVIFLNSSIITFTNCYIYGGPQGQPFGDDGSHSGVSGIFTNYTYLYFTIGSPYNATPGPNFNTNTLEIYQFGYNYPYLPLDAWGTGPIQQYSSFYNQPIPTHCYQITGVYVAYFSGTTFEPELEPSVLSDYVVNPPSAPVASVSLTGGVSTVTWSPHVGSTYSVYSATNITGPWTQAAYGLAYYPTNGAFTDNNKAKAKFYYITSP